MHLHRATESDFQPTIGHTEPQVWNDANRDGVSELHSAYVDQLADDQRRPEEVTIASLVIEALLWAAALALIAAMFNADKIWEKL